LLRALVDAEPWYGRMLELFTEYPWPFFLEGDQTPKYIPRFGRDAKDQFRAFSGDIKNLKPDDMTDDERLKHLALVIQRLINRYVEGRAEVKTGKKAKDFPKVKDAKGKERRIYPNEFREAQARVCTDAFLAMRSRHDQDFVEFFAGSICSVAQFLPAEDYGFLTKVLLTKPNSSPVAPRGITWEDVKTLAMIAVSACSFNVRPRETQAQGSNA
jgi:CRISPR-associated protein Cmx8